MGDFKKMHPGKKAVWLQALRSGEYEQGPGRLRSDDDRYCCLGVACDIFGEEWVQRRDRDGVPVGLGIHGNAAGRWGPGKDPAVTFPSQSALARWGLDGDAARVVAEMNDEGRSFRELADWIEENL